MILTKAVKVKWWGNGAKLLQQIGIKGEPKKEYLLPVEYLPKNSDKKVERKCEICNKIETIKYSEAIKHQQYCSKCYVTKILVGKKHPRYKESYRRYCIDCGKEISPGKNYKRCRKCFGKHISKENHYRWNNSRDLKRYRNGNMQRWSQAVKKRDNHTCYVCSSKESIIAHHLDSLSNNTSKMYDINNGVCLCDKCHKEFHSIYGYGNNTKEQFEDFYKCKKENKCLLKTRILYGQIY